MIAHPHNKTVIENALKTPLCNSKVSHREKAGPFQSKGKSGGNVIFAFCLLITKNIHKTPKVSQTLTLATTQKNQKVRRGVL